MREINLQLLVKFLVPNLDYKATFNSDAENKLSQSERSVPLY